jgi:glutathione synthase/RimK-type ligase-like ATP-grasp enzyme
MLSALIANDKLIEDLRQCAVREINNTPTCKWLILPCAYLTQQIIARHVVFRGNTVFTQMMERSMMWYGQEFLECSVGAVLRRLCAEKVAIEVDPNRTTKSAKEVKRNMDTLIHWCREFWSQINSAKAECPQYVVLFVLIQVC